MHGGGTAFLPCAIAYFFDDLSADSRLHPALVTFHPSTHNQLHRANSLPRTDVVMPKNKGELAELNYLATS